MAEIRGRHHGSAGKGDLSGVRIAGAGIETEGLVITEKRDIVDELLRIADKATKVYVTISSHEATAVLLPAVIEIRALREEVRRLQLQTQMGD